MTATFSTFLFEANNGAVNEQFKPVDRAERLNRKLRHKEWAAQKAEMHRCLFDGREGVGVQGLVGDNHGSKTSLGSNKFIEQHSNIYFESF